MVNSGHQHCPWLLLVLVDFDFLLHVAILLMFLGALRFPVGRDGHCPAKFIRKCQAGHMRTTEEATPCPFPSAATQDQVLLEEPWAEFPCCVVRASRDKDIPG